MFKCVHIFYNTLCNSNYFQCATVEANRTHKICNIKRQNEHVCGRRGSLGGVRDRKSFIMYGNGMNMH